MSGPWLVILVHVGDGGDDDDDDDGGDGSDPGFMTGSQAHQDWASGRIRRAFITALPLLTA